MTVTTAYGTDIEKVKEVILDYAKRDSLILNDPEPFVRMTNLNESSIEFTVRMWVKGKDYWDVRFNLSENIYKEFAANNIRIPAKQLDIHVKK
jgi:small conductance mechanosensitive channel